MEVLGPKVWVCEIAQGDEGIYWVKKRERESCLDVRTVREL